ncbi:MAG: hypothetical protein IJY36_02375 [Coprobacter sp.]|nr:hypothetical protein [Coprobacter sp.]
MTKKRTLKINDEPAWKMKARQKRYEEGYAEVGYADVWNLDICIARIIATHLHAYLLAVKGPYGGTPGRLVKKYGHGENAYKKWLQILRKMIYAFEEYPVLKNMSVDDETSDEKKARIKEGLHLLAEYLECLWI